MCAAAVALAAGCYDPHPATGIACTTTGQCPDGLFCRMGTCEHTAGGGTDAPPGDAPADTGVDGPAVVPALVQQTTGTLDHSATLSVTLPVAPAAGHMLVMIGANEHDNLSSVTGAGTTWMLGAASAQNANIEIWFGITDGTSATVTIDCNTNCAPQPIWLNVSEWSGLATTGAFDGALADNGLDSPAAAGALTTMGAHDLLVFAVSDLTPNTFGAPSPGTWQPLTEIDTAAVQQAAWFSLVGPGTYNPRVAESGNNWDAALVALRAAQ